MQIPLQLSYHGLPPSPAIESDVRRRAQKIDHLYGRITSLRVAIESRQHPHAGGQRFRVRLEVTIPGEDVIVSRDPGDDEAHRDIHVAIRDAFNAARRQLQDRLDRMRGRRVKSRNTPPHGIVARLFPEEGYGFLGTPDGRELYFHENSVLNGGFDELEIGMEVRFAEEDGEKGPQASTVEPIGKDGHYLAELPLVRSARM